VDTQPTFTYTNAMPRDPLLDDLTEPQRQAVLHEDGPLLVLAGAGSGKTRVITRRAARLAHRAGAHRVLAITFTNKAAEEMRERIGRLGAGRGMWVCTFHSLGARLLRMYGDRIGLRPNYSIFDQADRLAAIKAAMDDCRLNGDQWRPRTIEEMISSAKNDMQTAEEYAAQAGDFVARAVARIYARYQVYLREQNAVDFDDLLMYVAILLRDHQDVQAHLEDRFRYTLIDEYQDTNHAQYLIARGVSKVRRNLCATGDPDQSIYGWRGADIENILDFERDYPDATVIRLEQNFRSTKRILSVADRLIGHNKRRKKKSLWTDNDDGPDVAVWHCDDERDEARRIAEDIEHAAAHGAPAGQAAIFYRVQALTRVLEDALRLRHIPYQIARGVEFYNRKEIKDVLAWVRLVVNPADEQACIRAVQTPSRGIGKTTLRRLIDHARANKIALTESMTRVDEIESVKTGRKKVGAFSILLQSLAAIPQSPVQPFLERLIEESGLQFLLKNDPDPEKPALANVGELLSASAEYDHENPDGSVHDWIQRISLATDTDKIDLAGGAVTLMTVHAAKGLEFPTVYIAGLEDGLLPHSRAVAAGPQDIEEERRLFFVGMTRAMRRLVLTRAQYRMMRGFSERTMASRFLRELPRDELAVTDFSGGGDRYDDLVADVDDRLCTPGRLVRHREYGLGRVTWAETARGRPWIRVRFPAYGDKTFALQFAELEIVDT
jgi:DNA helicase-2/ATP-dependent DNA helicase PcrA